MQLLFMGPWGTAASAFFFLSALLGGDLLALRVALLLAYACLLINGLAGMPPWPLAAVPGRISIDAVLWSLAAGVLHGLAVLRMVSDELPVRFSSADDAQLARFLNRRSGMKALEAHEALKRGRWVRVKAGQRVVSSVQLNENVYLLVEGCCSYSSGCCPSPNPSHLWQQPQQQQQQQQQRESENVFGLVRYVSLPDPLPEASELQLPDAFKPPRQASPTAAAAAAAAPPACMHLQPRRMRMFRSGNVFSLSALNVFGVYIGFDAVHGTMLEVWAETDCLLYSWPLPALEEMAVRCSPSMSSFWRNFVLYSIASEFELLAHAKGMALPRCSTGEFEHDEWLAGARSRDFTDSLRAYEQPATALQRLRRWAARALSLWPPRGIRHTALPLTGVMARTRAMAMAEAHSQAARSREISIRMGTPALHLHVSEACCGASEGAGCHHHACAAPAAQQQHATVSPFSVV